jgi:hypothetical protein
MSTGSRVTRRFAALVAAVLLGTGSALVLAAPADAAKVPDPPGNVTARGGDAVARMTVTWTKPANLKPSSQPNYSIATAVDNGPFGAPVAVGRGLHAAMGCTGVTSCKFRVFAATGAGTSAPSATATGVWTTPGAPAIKTVTGGTATGRMAVTWTPPANTGGKAITGYLYALQVDSTGPFSGLTPVVGSNGAMTAAELPCPSTNPNGGCRYRLHAQNAIGASNGSAAVAGAWQVPAAPVLIGAVPGPSAHAATITWRPGTTTGGLANTYRYEVSVDQGPFAESPSALGLTGSLPVRSTVECPATSVCSYRLKAVSAKGASPSSATVSTAFDAPTVPRNLLARTWSLNLGAGSATVLVLGAVPANLGGSPLLRYEGQACAGNCTAASPAWGSATIESLGASPIWLPTCAAGNETCSYRLRAVNGIGPGPWSTPARLSPFSPRTVNAIPIAPSGSVLVGWGGPAEVGAGLAGFRLFRCVTSAGCASNANWVDTGQNLPPSARLAGRVPRPRPVRARPPRRRT